MNKLYKITILIIICILTSISIFIIYNKNYTNIYTFLSLGDGLSLGLNPNGIKDYGYNENIKNYLKEKDIKYDYFNYSEKNISIKELTNEIIYLDNQILENYMRKSNLIILSIGEYEISTNKNIDTIKKDINNLIKELKKYNNNICLLSKYNIINQSNNKVEELNNIFKEVSKQNNLKFINIESTSKYLINSKNYYPNSKGYENISYLIIKAMNINK